MIVPYSVWLALIGMVTEPVSVPSFAKFTVILLSAMVVEATVAWLASLVIVEVKLPSISTLPPLARVSRLPSLRTVTFVIVEGSTSETLAPALISSVACAAISVTVAGRALTVV